MDLNIQKKIYIGSMCILGAISIVHAENNAFQNFDNQVSFGMSAISGTLSANNDTNQNSFDTTAMTIETEKLFDIGLWLDVNVGSINSYVQAGTNIAPLGSYPFLATLNGKIGYNFPFTHHLAIKPYLLLGKNANATNNNAVLNGSTNNISITQDYYLTTGVGARLEYVIDRYWDVYLDQYVAYNADNVNIKNASMPDGSIAPELNSSNTQWTSTMGVKINLLEDLQLGANVFYTNFDGYGATTLQYYNQPGVAPGLPTNQYGIAGSVGWTF